MVIVYASRNKVADLLSKAERGHWKNELETAQRNDKMLLECFTVTHWLKESLADSDELWCEDKEKEAKAFNIFFSNVASKLVRSYAQIHEGI